MTRRFLSDESIAEQFDVKLRLVKEWVKRGWLKKVPFGTKRTLRVPVAQVNALERRFLDGSLDVNEIVMSEEDQWESSRSETESTTPAGGKAKSSSGGRARPNTNNKPKTNGPASARPRQGKEL